MNVIAEIFTDDRKNPNGCPIRGTFYISHQYTNYRDVQYLWNVGHEIAAHSVTWVSCKSYNLERYQQSKPSPSNNRFIRHRKTRIIIQASWTGRMVVEERDDRRLVRRDGRGGEHHQEIRGSSYRRYQRYRDILNSTSLIRENRSDWSRNIANERSI